MASRKRDAAVPGRVLIESMKAAVKIADRHEVTLAFEPELNNVVNSVSKARRLLDEIDSPWLKVVIDPANLLQSPEPLRSFDVISEAFDWLGPDIVLAHAKEAHIPKTDEVFYKFFMSRLITSLSLARYTGAIIMHGLEENEVETKAACLRSLLDSRSEVG